MSQFLDKFRGKSTKIGKEGILHILEHGFKPISLEKDNRSVKNVSHMLQSRSIEAIRNPSKVERIQLPPINLKGDEKLKNYTSHKSSRLGSSGKSGNRLHEFMKQREKQLSNGILESPLRKRRELIQQRTKKGPFDVPLETGYQMPQDEMRFLKSFERYKSSKHFSVHRKMSQRFGPQQ